MLKIAVSGHHYHHHHHHSHHHRFLIAVLVVSLARLFIQHPQSNHLYRLQPRLQANFPPSADVRDQAFFQSRRGRGRRDVVV